MARRRSSVFAPTVTVEVDPYDLADAGWHHEDDCPAEGGGPAGPASMWEDAAESLHRQAHPSQPLALHRCQEEPCRTIARAASEGATANLHPRVA